MIVSKWVRNRDKLDYYVTIPANSTATLVLPAKKIKESNQPLEKNPFIQIGKADNTATTLFLASGSYHFTF
jgi:hypothetical protein